MAKRKTVVQGPLPLHAPPEDSGHEKWGYALMGQALYDSPQGKDLVKRLESENEGILIEVLKGGGQTLQTQPHAPREAKLRAFHPDERIIKP